MQKFTVTDLYLDSVAQAVDEAIRAEGVPEDVEQALTEVLVETQAILQGPPNGSEEASDESSVQKEGVEAVQVDSESTSEEAPVL